MPEIDLKQSIRGFMEVYLINTGVRFDIFSVLSGKKLSIDQLVDKLKIPKKFIKIWCNTAYCFGVIERIGDKIYLKKNLEKLLADKDSTFYLGDFIRIMASYLGPDMEKQHEYIKKKKKLPFYEHDREFIELVVNRGRQRGNLYLTKIIPQLKDVEHKLNQGCDFLDLGCGGGSFLIALAQKYKKTKFTGVEIDDTSIKIAQKLMRKEALRNLSFFCTNGKNIDYQNEFDLITMNLVLHEIDPKHRKQIVKNAYKALKSNGKLVILEFPYPEKREDFSDPRFAMGIYDQFYEMIWGTKHITWTEQKEILESCSFLNIKRKFIDSAYVLITAEKNIS